MEDEWAAMDAGENLAIANVPTREFSYTLGIEIGERSVPAGMHDSSDMVGDFDFILIGLVTWISTNFFSFSQGQEEPVAEPGPKKASRRRAPKGAPQRATKGAPKRTKNFSHVEDEVMCAAYLTVSKDPIVGVNQALQAYWDRMEAYICTALKIKRDEARSRSSYQHRWGDIQKETSRFCSYYAQVERSKGSGTSEDDTVCKFVLLLWTDLCFFCQAYC